jgi:hypothetical protein
MIALRLFRMEIFPPVALRWKLYSEQQYPCFGWHGTTGDVAVVFGLSGGVGVGGYYGSGSGWFLEKILKRDLMILQECYND